jgi:hypothetical protein
MDIWEEIFLCLEWIDSISADTKRTFKGHLEDVQSGEDVSDKLDLIMFLQQNDELMELFAQLLD